MLLQPGGKTLKKKLPKSMNIGSLKLLCDRLFKIKADRQMLLLKAGQVEVRGEQAPTGVCN